MSEHRPNSSYLFQSSNRGSELKHGFHEISDLFISHDAGEGKETCSIVLHFDLRVHRVFKEDVIHLSLHLTLEDAKKLYAEYGATIEKLLEKEKAAK